jgi:hypothetical protein
MGRSTTPKYRLETWVNAGRHTPSAWEGRPTEAALRDRVCSLNESFMPGGVNGHVSQAAGEIVQVWMARIVRQSDDRVVAEWKAPPFATMPVCG